MKLIDSRIGVVLAAVLLSVVVPPSLHAANFKIKPVVLTGDSAPEGGTFNFVGQFSMNNSGGMAFTGRSTSSQGIYFSMDGVITRLVKDGTAVLGEMALTGLVKTEEIVSGTNRGTIYTFDQSFSLSGNRMFCDKTITGIDPFSVLLNESGDVVFKTGSRFFQESTNVVRLSGGTLTNLHCPAVSYIIGVQLSEEHFVRVHDANASVLSNAGTVFLGLFTTETFSRGSFNFRNFLVTGATATHVSDAETVIDINDSGDLLRGTSQGIFLNSEPVALIGGSAGPGKTIRSILAADLNNQREVVFAAFLSDFSRAIFHWANGVLTPLVRQFDPAPGGRTFSNFFSVRLNDNGDVAFSAETGPRSGVFLVSARGGLSKVVLPGDAAPGGGNFTVIGDPSFNNKGQIAFLGVLSNGKSGIFIASADQELELVARIEDQPEETKSVTQGSTVTARFPLGSPFSIRLAKKDSSGSRTPVQSTFTLEPSAIDPPIKEPTLFPNNVVVEFDRANASNIRFFQTVHFGNVILDITPTDTSISPVKVKLVVNKPQSLGTANSQVRDIKTGVSYNLDEKLVDLGHRRGIPPQMLKGQVLRESNFDLRAYRYEPLTVDLPYMSTCALRSANCNLRTRSPYFLYRLATDDGLSQGRDIFTDDIEPRSLYFIVRNRVIRQINNADQFVLGREIYEVNDTAIPDPAVIPDQNWSQSPLARQVERNPSLLNFTAQTPLAASYGLLQILYPTAIAPMQWPGIGAARNPSFLFDTQANLAADGGSLVLGSGYLRRVFSRANINVSLSDPDFPNSEAFRNAFQRAFNLYRGTTSESGLQTGPYGLDVLHFSDLFLPISASPIFQQ